MTNDAGQALDDHEPMAEVHADDAYPIVELYVLAPDAAGRVPATSPIEIRLGPGQRILPAARRAIATDPALDRPVLEVFVPEGAETLDRIPVLIVLEPAADPATRPATGPALDQARLPPDLQARAATWFAEWSGAAIPDLRAAWARPGWFDAARAWLDTTLGRTGHARSGPLEPQRAWGLSALLRAETTRGPVWLKAVMPHFHAEPAVTAWLAQRYPDAVPEVLGIDVVRRLLLTAEMPGGTARAAGGEATAPGAVALLATLQRDGARHLADLRARGLPERPLSALADDLARTWDRSDPVADLGLRAGRLSGLVDWVRAAADDLGTLDLPDGLVHGDFHAGNVGVDGDRLRIFDWSDAAIAHPLLDATPWMQDAATAEDGEALWRPWVEAWQDRVPASELASRRVAVAGLGAAYQLVSLDGILRGMEPAIRHTLSDSAAGYAAILDRAARGEG
jgi:hypothetical protein